MIGGSVGKEGLEECVVSGSEQGMEDGEGPGVYRLERLEPME